MPIAYWTVFASVLYVFCNRQPVEPLLYLLDCLLYTEVISYSTFVSELENLLTRGAKDDCAKCSFGSFADWCAQAFFDCKFVKTRTVVPQVMRFSLEFVLSRALCFFAPARSSEVMASCACCITKSALNSEGKQSSTSNIADTQTG